MKKVTCNQKHYYVQELISGKVDGNPYAGSVAAVYGKYVYCLKCGDVKHLEKNK